MLSGCLSLRNEMQGVAAEPAGALNKVNKCSSRCIFKRVRCLLIVHFSSSSSFFLFFVVNGGTGDGSQDLVRAEHTLHPELCSLFFCI